MKDLFHISGMATAHKGDPITSHRACDRMNADDSAALNAQQEEVLSQINEHPGVSNKRLGFLQAHKITGVPIDVIEIIYREATKPGRRAKELLSQGFITVDLSHDGKEQLNFITELGKDELK